MREKHGLYHRQAYEKFSREELLERIYQLEALFGLDFTVDPEIIRVSPVENKILGFLAYRDLTSMEQAMSGIYGAAEYSPGNNNLSVFLSRLRTKLRLHGVTIHRVWGQGWYLSPEDRAKVRGWDLRAQGNVDPLAEGSRAGVGNGVGLGREPT